MVKMGYQGKHEHKFHIEFDIVGPYGINDMRWFMKDAQRATGISIENLKIERR